MLQSASALEEEVIRSALTLAFPDGYQAHGTGTLQDLDKWITFAFQTCAMSVERRASVASLPGMQATLDRVARAAARTSDVSAGLVVLQSLASATVRLRVPWKTSHADSDIMWPVLVREPSLWL